MGFPIVSKRQQGAQRENFRGTIAIEIRFLNSCKQIIEMCIDYVFLQRVSMSRLVQFHVNFLFLRHFLQRTQGSAKGSRAFCKNVDVLQINFL